MRDFMRRAGRVGRIVPVVAVVGAVMLACSGCSHGIPSSSPDLTITAVQAAAIVTPADVPDGYHSDPNFEPSTITAADVLTQADENWTTNVKGSPEQCRPFVSAMSLSRDEDSGAAGTDAVDNLVNFKGDSDTNEIIAGVARVFGSTAQAIDFMSYAKAAVAQCPSGYQFGGDTPYWTTRAIEVTEDSSLEHGDAIQADNFVEQVQATGMSNGYRNTLLQRANLVVWVGEQIGPDAAVDYSASDAVLKKAATRLAAITKSAS